MSGKITFIYYFIFYHFYSTHSLKTKRAEIKGGILFEQDVTHPVIINPRYSLFHRTVNLNDLFLATDSAVQYAQTYVAFCDKVKETINSNYNTVKINLYESEKRYYLIPGLARLKDAPFACENLGYTLPEIRTFNDLKFLKAFANKAGVNFVYAGVLYKSEEAIIKYRTTKTPVSNVFDHVKYVVENHTQISPIYHLNATKHWQNNPYAVYELTNKSRNYILLQPHIENTLTSIVCQFDNPHPHQVLQNEYTLEITNHICSRDKPRLERDAHALYNEISLFKIKPETENFHTLPQDELEFLSNPEPLKPLCDHIRSKTISQIYLLMKNQANKYTSFFRLPYEISIKFIQYLILDNETQTHSFTNFLLQPDWHELYNSSNPFFIPMSILNCYLTDIIFSQEYLKQWDLTPLFEADHTNFLTKILKLNNPPDTPDSKIKRVKRVFLMFPTVIPSTQWQTPLNSLTTTVDEQSKALTELNLHKDEIKEAYDRLRLEVNTLKNVTRLTEHAINAMFAEHDTKNAFNQLYSLIQTALLKLSSAMSEALDHRTSPYVLAANELQSLSKNNTKFSLSTRPEDVYTELIKDDSSYIFSFAIPVLDENSTYSIYNTRPIPIFGPNNSTFTPQPDMQFFGISNDTRNYISFSLLEYLNCIQSSFCIISGPPIIIKSQLSCTIQSFFTNSISCPTVPTPEAIPFFATYGNNTTFSVPPNYQIKTICPPQPFNISINLGPTSISGLGTLILQQNCYLHLPDNRNISNQHQPDSSTDLGISNIMVALHYYPSPQTYHFNWTNNSFWANWTDVPTLELPPWTFNFTKTIHKMFDPEEVTAHLGRTIALILITIIIFLSVCYSSSKCFTWTRTWLLVQPPKQYWTEEGYHVPGYFKIPKGPPTQNKSTLWKEYLAQVRKQKQFESDIEEERAQLRGLFNPPKAPSRFQAVWSALTTSQTEQIFGPQWQSEYNRRKAKHTNINSTPITNKNKEPPQVTPPEIIPDNSDHTAPETVAEIHATLV